MFVESWVVNYLLFVSSESPVLGIGQVALMDPVAVGIFVDFFAVNLVDLVVLNGFNFYAHFLTV